MFLSNHQNQALQPRMQEVVTYHLLDFRIYILRQVLIIMVRVYFIVLNGQRIFKLVKLVSIKAEIHRKVTYQWIGIEIHLLLGDNTKSTRCNKAKNDRYSDLSTQWILGSVKLPLERFGIRIIYDEIDTALGDIYASVIIE